MKFPKTLVFLTALNLTLAADFVAAAAPDPTPAPAQAVAAPAAAATPSSPRSAVSPAPSPAAPAAEDIRDIRGPISIPYGWLWAAYTAAGIALVLAAYAGWRWYRRHAAERAKLPYEIALERLEKARALMTEPQAREYSFAVSETVRRYIETRFGERAARRTTEEFLHDLLARTDTPLAAFRESLEDVLAHCDLAKFARWQLSVPDMEAMHASARAFILETAPSAGNRHGTVPPVAQPQPTRSQQRVLIAGEAMPPDRPSLRPVVPSR